MEAHIEIIEEALQTALKCVPDIGKGRYRKALAACWEIRENGELLRVIADLAESIQMDNDDKQMSYIEKHKPIIERAYAYVIAQNMDPDWQAVKGNVRFDDDPVEESEHE